MAILVLIVLVVWLATGEIRTAEDEAPERQDESTAGLPSVQVELRQASTFEPAVRLQGQIEA